ncbi:uncharacterized protein LOC112560490 isoform X1 [Pomacea canaliculata]|uniref:uncharacterized protein LOC112560490 isoform X1 n=1 Tax=Pomacea canaliculata TaxID=400727 RepID=UPI000D7386DD|nr:uncharacterized protein LOC112560490 isoform X1 [Pomacea canaliculata]
MALTLFDAGPVTCVGLHRSQVKAVSRSQAAHENDKCDNVASCLPPDPTSGDPTELCSIFLKSVACMGDALDACRRIPNFSEDLLAESEARIMELRTELTALNCVDDATFSEPMLDDSTYSQVESDMSDMSDRVDTRPGAASHVLVNTAVIVLTSCISLLHTT